VSFGAFGDYFRRETLDNRGLPGSWNAKKFALKCHEMPEYWEYER
jgi:hypothetical protein